jgi:Kef-type K+ transport system membrane component KefB
MYNYLGCTSMLLEITVAIVFAKILSTLLEKIKQPGVIGEILAGVLLGPCCIGLLSGSSISILNTTFINFTLDLTSPEFKDIAFIGSVFLLFIVGLETNLNDLGKTKKAGLGVGVIGIITPFLFGCMIGFVFHLSFIQCMAIGTIFLATSTAIAIRILSDMDLLASRVGLTLRTALVVNDVLAMVFFALVFGIGNSVVLLLQISVFFGLTIGVGLLVVRYTGRRSTKRHTPVIVLTSSLGICFLFAAFAENMGLTAIIGAFIAGIFVRKTPQAGVIAEYIKTIGYAFFVPLFFVWVGASFDFLSLFSSSQLSTILLFCAAFVIFSMLGNFLGSTAGARLGGMKQREAISIGLGMMPVMGVSLIIVSTGIDRGIFGAPDGMLANQIKTATLLLIFVSCLLTPVLLKRSMGSSILKRIGKSKTKPMFYNHPHCTTCNFALRLIPEHNEWYCDYCGKPVIPQRVIHIHRYKTSGITDKQMQYIIGAVTILICGLAIQNMMSSDLIEKLSALVGIVIGTTIGFLTIKYLFIKKPGI